MDCWWYFEMLMVCNREFLSIPCSKKSLLLKNSIVKFVHVVDPQDPSASVNIVC